MPATALLDPRAAAAYLGVSRRELLAWAKRGEIGCVRASGREVVCRRRAARGGLETLTYTRDLVRFTVADLDAWIARHYTPGREATAAARPPATATARAWESIPAGDRQFS